MTNLLSIEPEAKFLIGFCLNISDQRKVFRSTPPYDALLYELTVTTHHDNEEIATCDGVR